jgi:DNA-directed RNA polymerase omega subunit
MINKPSVESLIEKLDQNGAPASRYALCVVVAKRARQIIEHNISQMIKDKPGADKEITLACKEIESGKVKAVKD